MQNGIFDGTLTVGAIGGELYDNFSNPVASALKPFFKSALILRAFIYAIHWVAEPAPLDENRNISFFSGSLCYSGTRTHSTIYWAFMTIHNSSQSHYQIIYHYQSLSDFQIISHKPSFCSV